jgi:hypothetical protein
MPRIISYAISWTVETECLDDDFDTSVFFNGKNFKRYFCYSAPSSTLDLHDKVHYDKFGAHANIFSPIWKHQTLTLRRGRCFKVYIYIGYFPKICSMEWKFCCSLLDCSQIHFEKLKTTTWVKPVYDDTRVGHVYDVISEHLSSTRYVETGDKSREIME